MSKLLCGIVHEPHATIVRLSGQITHEEMEDFARHSERILAAKPPLVVLDLCELEVLTSAGIGALLKLEKKLRETNCPVRIAAPRPSIAELFKLTRLDAIFKIVPTVDEAFA